MSVHQKIDLTDAQLRLVCGLIGRHLRGAQAWAYGSRVKGTSRRNSDLDLVVFIDEASRSQVADLQESFDESDLPFSIDLHVWGEISAEFQQQIAAQKLDLSSWLKQND